MMRRLLFAAVSAAIIMGVSGCMAPVTLQEQVIAHMNEKYDDTFSYHGPFGGGAGGPTQMLLESAKFPGETFWISCQKKDGELIVKETYPCVMFLKQTQELITSILDEAIEADYYMISCGGGERAVSENFSSELTFEEYIADKKSGINFFITIDGLVPEGERSDFEASLVNAFIEHKVCVSVGRLDFVENSEVYEKYKAAKDVASMASLREECGVLGTTLFMKADGTAEPFEWEEF